MGGVWLDFLLAPPILHTTILINMFHTKSWLIPWQKVEAELAPQLQLLTDRTKELQDLRQKLLSKTEKVGDKHVCLHSSPCRPAQTARYCSAFVPLPSFPASASTITCAGVFYGAGEGANAAHARRACCKPGRLGAENGRAVENAQVGTRGSTELHRAALCGGAYCQCAHGQSDLHVQGTTAAPQASRLCGRPGNSHKTAPVYVFDHASQIQP